MADSNGLQTLLSSKAALDLGLITQEDFDAVKASFLRAQQIKAAVDVGLIKQDDYESAKNEYLSSLTGAVVAAPQVSRPAAPAAKPAATAAYSAPAPAAPRSNGAADLAAAAAAPPPAPRPVPVAAAAAAPVASPAAAAPPSAPGSAQASPLKKVASNPNVPSNLPKVGGVKPKSGGTSMSGIEISEDAVNLFYHMRSKSAYRWAMWQVDDAGTTVVIAAVGDKEATYQDFLASLPDSDCRYGVFDYQYTTPDGQVLNKLVFINWAPDSARIKSKMMYASTKDFFKSHLDGISLEFQASEVDDITEEEVGGAVRALKRT